MSLLERIEADYKTALKAGERLRVDTLRLVKAGVQREAIQLRKERLDDPEVLRVLGQQAKQKRETMEAAKQGGRQDVLGQATQELAILNTYLPQALSEDAIRRLIDEAIGSLGAQQGPVMKYVMGKAAGAADGRLVSQLVAQRLKAG
jgi:hypothetical protein